jgi:hypothetical protein
MQSALDMAQPSSGDRIEEVPLDFAEFLSRRLGVEPGKALSLLGSFLVSFEPLGNVPGRSPRPAAFHQ